MQTTALNPGVSTAQANSDRQTLAGDFDGFLKLLTTQLQHQDPTAPMDADKFTSQLVQFASVEQALATNARLDRLANLTDASARATALGYLGAEVEMNGAVVELDGQGADLRYALEREATDVFVRFYDAAGNLVHVDAGGLKEGQNLFEWNGRLADGSLAPTGSYRIEIDALDVHGRAIPVEFRTKGVVDSVSFDEAGGAVLLVGGVEVPLTSVRSVGKAATPAT
jgi:flagellar basal-body rod modification protein FlgD